jgi:hypothetical protein
MAEQAALKNTTGHRSAGSTDVIRQMLKEQKEGCKALHQNPLFKEFRNQRGKRRFRKGYEVEATSPIIDDLEAEGQQRLLLVIEKASTDYEKNPRGVWASFGKPYRCLGNPEQVGRCTHVAPLLSLCLPGCIHLMGPAHDRVKPTPSCTCVDQVTCSCAGCCSKSVHAHCTHSPGTCAIHDSVQPAT